jgi:tRNA dimethylallyltransferase
MTEEVPKTLFVVVGPTAVGKTKFAISLAKLLNTEIISADSRQFYKEMKIGTAVPEPEDLAAVQHHFIQHLSIHDYYNVYKFEQDALKKIDALFSKYHQLVLVGGSGLYINAVIHGIDDFPDPTEEIRTYINDIQNEKGLEGLQDLLREKDPDFFEVIDKNNPNRIKRALEVCLTANQPYSAMRSEQSKKRKFNVKWIGLDMERSILYHKINNRVDQMIEEGLLQEVKQLYEHRNKNALNTVGYREFFRWLSVEESYEWAVKKVKTNSRRYAKRQMTWFRKNKEILWLDRIDDNEVDKYLRSIRMEYL